MLETMTARWDSRTEINRSITNGESEMHVYEVCGKGERLYASWMDINSGATHLTAFAGDGTLATAKNMSKDDALRGLFNLPKVHDEITDTRLDQSSLINALDVKLSGAAPAATTPAIGVMGAGHTVTPQHGTLSR